MAKLSIVISAVVGFGLLGGVSVAKSPSSPTSPSSFRKPARALKRPSPAISQPDLRDILPGSLWMTTPPKSWGTLNVISFDSSTSLGKLFRASAIVVSDSELPVPRLLGRPVVVGAELASGRQVLVHGYVSEISTSHTAGDQYQYHYQIEIESWLQAMSRAAHFRVFHDRTAPEILEDLFSHYPTASYRMELSRDYPTHATMFQYRETDLNFAQRLMEHVGIYYHWEHSEGGHVLVLRDSNAVAGSKLKTALKVADLGRRAKVRPNVYSITDFNLQTPEAGLAASARTKRDGLVDSEVEDFEIGTLRTSQEARWYSQVRLDEERASAEIITAEVTDGSILHPGVQFDVAASPMSKQAYLVTESVLSASFGGSSGVPTVITSRVTAIPASQTFRPSRQTPWPQISGTLVATVLEVTPSPDGVTRCKLQFPWVTGEGARMYLWGVAAPALDLAKGDYVSAVFVDGSPAQPVVTAIVRSNARALSRR